jgi:adenine-specific DNA-methyltransferase
MDQITSERTRQLGQGQFETIRFAGSKKGLVPLISTVLEEQNIRPPGEALDGFAGSARVSWYLRSKGFEVTASDKLLSSYYLQSLALCYKDQPAFTGLLKTLGRPVEGTPAEDAVVGHLMALPHVDSFAVREYSPSMTGGRNLKYFTVDNARIIDTVREGLRDYLTEKLLTKSEHNYLLALLIIGAARCANTQAHTEAPLKIFHPNAKKPLEMRIPRHLPTGKPLGTPNCGDVQDVINSGKEFDMVYADPPYDQRRYDSLYHLLETIAHGKLPVPADELTLGTGKAPATGRHSRWNVKPKVTKALQDLLNVKATHFLMSYSSEGHLSPKEIERELCSRGIPRTYKAYEQQHPRYQGGEGRGGGTVTEFIHYVRLR